MIDAVFWERGKNCRPYPLRVPGEWAAVLYFGYNIIFSALKQPPFHKICFKKRMIMTPFACRRHFGCAVENLLRALLIFGFCAEIKIFVIVKKNASL